jgi:hypothetical protein
MSREVGTTVLCLLNNKEMVFCESLVRRVEHTAGKLQEPTWIEDNPFSTQSLKHSFHWKSMEKWLCDLAGGARLGSVTLSML